MATNPDFDDEEAAETTDEEQEEVSGKKRNPLRMVILVLAVLVAVCLVCYLGSSFMGGNILGFLPGFGPTEPAAPVATEQPGEVAPATEQPGEAAPATEQPGEAAPATEQPGEAALATEQPGAAASATEQPGAAATQEAVAPAQVAPTEEKMAEQGGGTSAEATTQPVPGPSPTLEAAAAADCDNNTSPTANAGGPYNAMMGKGQAFVTLDGSSSTDSDGSITQYAWDFGDGSASGVGQSVMHGYSQTGAFVVTLTVTDNCNTTAQATADVTVVGPTPPATVTVTPPVSPTVEPPSPPAPTAEPPSPPMDEEPFSPPIAGTFGFCHLVQPGQTLTGIAWIYGVTVEDLAAVNEVCPDYYVLAGQGLFIPSEPIQPGANLYEVQEGDTLYSVAYQCGLRPEVLSNANGLSLEQPLTPGQVLGIPLWQW